MPEALQSDATHHFHSVDVEFLCGDSLDVLKRFPDESVDMCMTSPPYWGQREYDVPGLGLEEKWEAYVDNLCAILDQVQRVLKPQGSLWLNLGDTYQDKSLIGIPWRVALRLVDAHGWTLRNDIVWNKLKGAPDNSKDKLRNIHEPVFHLVKNRKYYYDADSIRSKPRESTVVNGAVVSATGVSGVRYKRQIELSTALTPAEKIAALRALQDILLNVRDGHISDSARAAGSRARARSSSPLTRTRGAACRTATRSCTTGRSQPRSA